MLASSVLISIFKLNKSCINKYKPPLLHQCASYKLRSFFRDWFAQMFKASERKLIKLPQRGFNWHISALKVHILITVVFPIYSLVAHYVHETSGGWKKSELLCGERKRTNVKNECIIYFYWLCWKAHIQTIHVVVSHSWSIVMTVSWFHPDWNSWKICVSRLDWILRSRWRNLSILGSHWVRVGWSRNFTGSKVWCQQLCWYGTGLWSGTDSQSYQYATAVVLVLRWSWAFSSDGKTERTSLHMVARPSLGDRAESVDILRELRVVLHLERNQLR